MRLLGRAADVCEAVVVVLLAVVVGWVLRVGESSALGWMLVAGLPFALLLAPPSLLVGVAVGRRRLVAGAMVLVVAQAVIVWPLLPGGGPDAPGSGEGAALRISALNVYVDNDDPSTMAAQVLAIERDVVGFVELTPEAEAALETAGIDERYPHRVGTALPGTVGAVLYSRYPVTLVGEPTSEVLAADVDVPGLGRTRVLLVHVFPPAGGDQGGWRRTLAELDRTLEAAPTPWIAIGDYNATHTHRPYRDLLRDGRRDAHLATGRGRAATWPADGRILPTAFLIDRAIMSPDLEAVRTAERTVAGADHRMVDVDVDPGR
jgi:endonuclease/exonuclease/phosphatase (EEP) superfamily protein YafD